MRATILVAVTQLLLAMSISATPGDVEKSHGLSHNCPQGLTFDGKYLWNVDRLTDMIYKIDPGNGAVIDSIESPGYVPRGLTWDGSLLWCVDAEEKVFFAINPKTRIVEKTIYCPVSKPAGLAWDGENIWIADYGADEIHKISTEDGTTINSIPAPSRMTTGLAFDGKYLWIADRTDDRIYMATVDGDVILSIATPGPHAWGLAWDGERLWNVDYETDSLYQLVVDDGAVFERTDEKTQEVEFIHQIRNYGPGTVTTADVYLAKPKDRDNQHLLTDVEFSLEPTGIIEDQWGQKVAHFHFDDLGPTEFRTVSMTVQANLYANNYFIYPERVGQLDEIPEDIRELYLVDNTKFSFGSSVIQSAVDKAVSDETNPYWIARRIFNYVIEHMEYELAGGWNIAPTVLERGNGSCSEYSFVYIAMCRAAGLPARYVGSIAIRGDDASYDEVFHRWVEVYLPGFGWIPVDPSGGDSDWPARRAGAFGHLGNRFLITTEGGGGSDYLGWSYNANEYWTSKGRCKIVVENFGEWSPVRSE